MFIKVDSLFSESDISIFAAAVTDYTPESKEPQKIKKSSNSISLDLKKTKDILSLMSSRKKASQFVVGFALETENEIENAKSKLISKKLDMIVMNSLNNKATGFEFNTNKITVIDKTNSITDFKLKDKKEVAKDIIKMILKQT